MDLAERGAVQIDHVPWRAGLRVVVELVHERLELLERRPRAAVDADVEDVARLLVSPRAQLDPVRERIPRDRGRGRVLRAVALLARVREDHPDHAADAVEHAREVVDFPPLGPRSPPAEVEPLDQFTGHLACAALRTEEERVPARARPARDLHRASVREQRGQLALRARGGHELTREGRLREPLRDRARRRREPHPLRPHVRVARAREAQREPDLEPHVRVRQADERERDLRRANARFDVAAPDRTRPVALQPERDDLVESAGRFPLEPLEVQPHPARRRVEDHERAPLAVALRHLAVSPSSVG